MPTSVSERVRLDALASYDILDTAPEESFDRIARLMSACFDVPVATVAFVDAERTWGKAFTGFDPSIEREHSFCLHVVAENQALVLEDVRRYPAFNNNPLVTGAPGVRFYAGVPVRTPDGIPVGTVCMYDTEPRSFSSANLERLRDFAALVTEALERRRTDEGTAPDVALRDDSGEEAPDPGPSSARSSDGVLWLDANMRIQRADTRFVKMTGYTRNELEGKCPGRLLYGPATDGETIATINQHLDQGESFSQSLLLYRKSGAQYWVRVEAEPQYNGDTCTGFRFDLFDITEECQRDDALSALTSFYEQALKELPVEVAVMDPDGRYLFLNPASVGDDDLREWLIGKTAVDYARRRGLDPAPFERRQAMVRRVAETGEPESLEDPVTTDDGETKYILRVAHPVTDDVGEVVRVFGYGVDVTERKKREQNLLEAKEQAEKMNRLKTAFLANMSHEIRTPLTSIIGFAEVLAEEVSGPRKEMADLIQRSGGRLKETLTSVLEFARLEGEAMSLAPERLDLGDRVRETAELLRPQIQEKALTLTLDLPESSVEACLDGAALDRVLTNLLTNAIKFTEEGQITVALQAEDDTVILTVEDTGPGISEDFLERIYDAFEQESSGTARTHEGIGLGLTITQRLVDLMDGTIEIESAEEEGTRVTVQLPRTEAPEQAT
jgi:PAS domain S-box-containing protein